MLMVKMILVPIFLFVFGSRVILQSPEIGLLLAACGFASAIIYRFTPYSTSYGYKPYAMVTGCMTALAVFLLCAGYTGG